MKTILTKKKAFTLIELLIVIAIIGILFIVLVSKVDFATDKAKASGVQTDFRSFQMAFDTIAKENAGFNTLGWDTGDDNGDRIRNSYDKGDKACGQAGCTECKQDGKQGPHEVWVGSKTYGETWNEVFTLVNPSDNTDTSAFIALENAINANLDPKLHITITPDVEGTALTGNATITMANQARDPWKNEYHGAFITNAVRDDGADRGAIVMYSDGANGKWGSAHDITNGVVSVTVPGNNTYGKDDYSLVSCYTFTNGYGEVQNMTTGFSNNQSFMAGGNGGSGDGTIEQPAINHECENLCIYCTQCTNNSCNHTNCLVKCVGHSVGATFTDGVTLSWEELQLAENGSKYRYQSNLITDFEIVSSVFYQNTQLVSIVVPNSVTTIGYRAFSGCTSLTSVEIPSSVTSIGSNAFEKCSSLAKLAMPIVGTKFSNFFGDYNKPSVSTVVITGGNHIPDSYFANSYLKNVVLSDSIVSISKNAWPYKVDAVHIRSIRSWFNIDFQAYNANPCYSSATLYVNNSPLTNLVIPDTVTEIKPYAMYYCDSINSITIPENVTMIGNKAFSYCTALTEIIFNATEMSDFNSDDAVIGIFLDAGKNGDGIKVVIGKNVTRIPAKLFYAPSNKPKILSVSFEEGSVCTSIGSTAFYYCTSLTSVMIPNSVTSIENSAFFGCKSLANVNIPESVTSIGDGAFSLCTSLTSIVIPDSVTSIGSRAFDDCDSLTSIVIPDSVNAIGENTFYSCDSLTSVVIGDSVNAIGDEAFRGCSSLTSITFNGTIAQWSAISKGSLWDYIVPATYIQCSDGQVNI